MAAKRRRTELASPFLISIADLFLGASATLLCIIVVTAAPQNPRVPQVVDLVLECRRTAEGQWLVAPARKSDAPEGDSADRDIAFKPSSRWLADLKVDALLLRVGVQVGRSEMPCFIELERSATAHNRMLSARGTILPAVALVLIPSERP